MRKHHRPKGASVRGIRVADHALIRWLERNRGMDMREVAREMVGNAEAALIRKHPNKHVDLDCGARLIVRDGVVVSTYFPGGKRRTA